jgi:phosphoenolpyruvate carboxylase
VSATKAVAQGIPAPLRREVRLLSTVLGRVLEEAGGPELLSDVERLRRATIAFRGVPSDERRAAVVDLVEGFALGRAEQVARAFTVYFQLVNLAEEHQRIRALRDRARRGEGVPHSLAETVREVRERAGDETLSALLDRLEITAVLTAHPTEARRRSVVETLRRIADQLDRFDDARLTPEEGFDVERCLHEEITALWRTDQLRPAKPEPHDEVRAAMWLFDESIFALVPRFYRELDRALSPDAGTHEPAFRPFLTWGSWIGGDRDGNPAVNASVTAEVLDIHADHVLRGLERAARRVARELSSSQTEIPPSPELLASLEADARTFPSAAKELERKLPDAPHRRKLTLAAERLGSTRAGLPEGYAGASAFLADLAVIQRSLADGGAPRLAYGELQHLIWQAHTFGFHLAALEIRQHASVHARAVEELAPDAAVDAAALDRLAAGGGSGRPPPLGQVPDPTESTAETLATLRTMARIQRRFGADACRRYVVSFTRSAADVLRVRLLARLAVPDGSLEIDVVPLFESRVDLEAAPTVLDELLSYPGFAAWLDARRRRLEVMLGYSDSAKDVGPLAANLVLYRAQRELAAWARRNGVELTLFHGRGGALGRGGGPAGRAIGGQAPGSVNGRFKVTEQGEVTVERYGSRRIAQRHLEQITSAVLAASLRDAETDAERAYDGAAGRMAEASERAWRTLVDRPGFAEFFAMVTPYSEIEHMSIGSRPPRRGEGTDLASLRAIPWVFAWSQNRCNLPGWYGLGSGLAAVAEEPGGIETLRGMYREWAHFTSVIENVQLSLTKADLPIAQLYLRLGEDADVARRIEEEYERTVKLVLDVTQQERLLERRVVLRRAIELRNAYVDALSFLQLRFLGELRGASARTPEREAQLRRLVQLTVNGLAAGLQNTG